jgi:hypothetical protein
LKELGLRLVGEEKNDADSMEDNECDRGSAWHGGGKVLGAERDMADVRRVG